VREKLKYLHVKEHFKNTLKPIEVELNVSFWLCLCPDGVRMTQ
jgi:hypothetical protein